MSPNQFRITIDMMRRRAMEGDRALWALIDDAEALLEGRHTTMSREEVTAAVEREMPDWAARW